MTGDVRYQRAASELYKLFATLPPRGAIYRRIAGQEN